MKKEAQNILDQLHLGGCISEQHAEDILEILDKAIKKAVINRESEQN